MDVYEATKLRIKFAFENFDYVYVSFSGGKDSGVMLNMVDDYVKETGYTKKYGLFHVDYEAQYQMTTDYVTQEYLDKKDNVEPYWLCLPIAAQCATSMSNSYWIPWQDSKKDIWVRELPENSINESNHEFDFFHEGQWDYDLQNKFGEWLKRKKGVRSVACLVGIRTDESMNRWRALHSDNRLHMYNGIKWTKRVSDDVYNVYPVYDWSAEDIWTVNFRQGYLYNKLYDLYYQAGLTVHQMRVASPFNDCAMDSLKLYKVIDPNNWGKMIGRTNGVNFAGLYGGTTAMGWQSIKLPKGHTWKSYMEFLLSTLPKDAEENYRKKLEVSQVFWRDRGGVLSETAINDLADEGVKFKLGASSNYKTDKKPVTMEYLDSTNSKEFKSIPSYKRMCICIMKNDHLCKYMGFGLTKTETEKRKTAEKKYLTLSGGEK